MATTHKTNFTSFTEMLEHLRETAQAAAGVAGADDVGCFLPIRKYGESRQMGEFSSLSEWLDDVADSLQDFLKDEADEIETWEV